MYKYFGIRYTFWYNILKFLSLFIRILVYPDTLKPENFKAFIDHKTVVYILPRMSIIDLIVLNKFLKSIKQSRVHTEAKPNRFKISAFLALKPRSVPFVHENKDVFLSYFTKLIENDPRAKNKQITFLPVSIFWSRSPEKNEKGFILNSLFPDDGTGNGLQKLFMLLLHRGEVNLYFSKTIDPNNITTQIENDETLPASENDTEFILAKKMRRLFNIEFARQRTAIFGPTLYDNEKITQWILSTNETKKLLSSSDNNTKTEQQIVSYIQEIAAKYNYLTIRALEKVFDFIWNKVFDGLKVRNFEKIERVARDGQIIWMPSHRSHFDYLLLSCVLFRKGLAVPHIAAGINLNFWPVGSILRKGGAFFLRRSFSGNKVYAHTFSQYVNFLLQNSYPLEFFQEGGRSRIGKLLSPKLGLLSICVQSIISRKAENTYFIPVYFSYDKVMEDESYARELKGSKKHKENAWQFLNGIRKIFSNYGSVDVSFGEPIRIADVWSDYYQKIKRDSECEVPFAGELPEKFIDFSEKYDVRDAKIQGFVKYLGRRINQKINSAAVASSTSILSTILLTMTRNPIKHEDLKYRMTLLHWVTNAFGRSVQWNVSTNHTMSGDFDYIVSILNASPLEDLISELHTVPEAKIIGVQETMDQFVKMGKRWHFMKEIINRDQILFIRDQEKEFSLWWYRGTIFHIYAAFGLIAALILKNLTEKYFIQKIEFYISILRKLWQDELYWDSKTSTRVIIYTVLNIYETLGFLSKNETHVFVITTDKNIESLEFFAKIVSPELELYGLQTVAALSLMNEKSTFSRDELLSKSFSLHQSAYTQGKADHAPNFSKVFGFRAFDAFSKNGIYLPDEGGKLTLNTEAITNIAEILNVNYWNSY